MEKIKIFEIQSTVTIFLTFIAPVMLEIDDRVSNVIWCGVVLKNTEANEEEHTRTRYFVVLICYLHSNFQFKHIETLK